MTEEMILDALKTAWPQYSPSSKNFLTNVVSRKQGILKLYLLSRIFLLYFKYYFIQ